MSLGDVERGAGQWVCALESSSICGVFGTVLPLSRSTSVYFTARPPGRLFMLPHREILDVLIFDTKVWISFSWPIYNISIGNSLCPEELAA